jgi:hypothetical protein
MVDARPTAAQHGAILLPEAGAEVGKVRQRAHVEQRSSPSGAADRTHTQSVNT